MGCFFITMKRLQSGFFLWGIVVILGAVGFFTSPIITDSPPSSLPITAKGGVEVDFVKQLGIPYTFTKPNDLVFTPDGGYFILMNENERILQFDHNANLIGRIGGVFGPMNQPLFQPSGIATNSTGHLFVADSGNCRVLIFSPQGEYLKTLGTVGTGNGEFSVLGDIAINGSDYIYIADYGNHRVQIFNPDATFLKSFGTQGSGDGQFSWPRAIAINQSGAVYVGDTLNVS